MKPRTHIKTTPQNDARHYARRLDDLAAVLPHVIGELHEALLRCGGDVCRDVCGVLGQAGLIEQTVQNLTAMLAGESKASLPSFAGDVERALIRAKHDL